tara:strand:+ start:4342 stop:4800 length:459 start_codon:yes stop_codon:yes gene_type:complete
MVDPLTIAAAATAASGVMGFTGGKGAAKSAAAIGEYNAQLAERERELLKIQTAQNEANLRKQSERLVASQRQATSASGIQIAGSPLQALFDSYMSTEFDSLQVMFAGDVQQQAKISEAALARAGGNARKQALQTQAYQTLLSSGSKTAQLLA